MTNERVANCAAIVGMTLLVAAAGWLHASAGMAVAGCLLIVCAVSLIRKPPEGM